MRTRMTLIFGFAVAVIMCLGGNEVVRRERVFAEEQLQQTLEVAAERADYEIGEEENAHVTLLRVMKENAGEIAAGGLVIFVTDARGHLLWRSRHVPFPVPEDEWRTRQLPYKNQWLVLAGSWRPSRARLRHTALSLMALGTLLVLASAAGAWLVVGRTLSPIDALASEAANASAAETGVRLHAPSPDAEMLRLADTFNGLLERLENEALSRGRFYSAASHELRTPLQALLGHLDVALSRPREATEYESALREAQKQTERLTRLVQDLLQLTALETGSITTAISKVDMGDLLDRTLSTLGPLAVTRQVSLITRIPEISVSAPQTHLEILTRNLLENSIKYATPGTVVTVELFEQEEGAKLRVFNHCDLPDGANPKDWFEPFFRPDASRNSLTGGNGLGLAIAASVARVNGWEISLQAVEDGVEAVVVVE